MPLPGMPNVKPSGFADAVNVIGRAQRTGAGHILNDDVWVSWDVLAHVSRQDAGVLVSKDRRT